MLLILKVLPPGVIEVFTAVHMFYKSAAGEHLLSVPFFLISFGRVIERIVLDQYHPSPPNTHTNTHHSSIQMWRPQLHTAAC